MKFKALGHRAKDFPNIHKSPSHSQGISTNHCPYGCHHSSRSAGSNPPKDASSGLDGTDQDTKTHKDEQTSVNSILGSYPDQVAFEFIPSSLFPAKPLVKTILSLIQLGIVSDVSSQMPLPIFIISHPPKKFVGRSKTSITFRVTSLLISLTWPKYLFESGGSQLSQKAWEDLQETRWAL